MLCMEPFPLVALVQFAGWPKLWYRTTILFGVTSIGQFGTTPLDHISGTEMLVQSKLLAFFSPQTFQTTGAGVKKKHKTS